MRLFSRTPLRLSLAGGGTDVEPFLSLYGSIVLNFSINLFVRGFATFSQEQKAVKLNAIEYGSNNKTYDEKDETFANALMEALIRKFSYMKLRNIHLSIQSPVSPGSGLGASSAVIVTAVGLVSRILGLKLDSHAIAALAWEIERNDMNIAGGFQDHYATVFGGFNLMSGTDSKKIDVKKIEIEEEFIREFEDSIMLVDLGLSRDGGLIIKKQQERTFSKDQFTIAALIEQKKIVNDILNSILNKDIKGIGIGLEKAWNSKKRFTESITNTHIDKIHDQFMNSGAFGVKLSGAGGGGHMMIVFPREIRNDLVSLSTKLNLVQREILTTSEGFRCWNH